VSGQLQASAVLPPGKEPTVPTGYGAGLLSFRDQRDGDKLSLHSLIFITF